MDQQRRAEIEAAMLELEKDNQRKWAAWYVPDQIDGLLLMHRMWNDVVDGQEWVEPADAASDYPVGAVVTYDGQEWISLRTANSDRPGQSRAWRLRSERPESGPWDDQRRYALGDEVVYLGAMWRSTRDDNDENPAANGIGWVKIDPETGLRDNSTHVWVGESEETPSQV